MQSQRFSDRSRVFCGPSLDEAFFGIGSRKHEYKIGRFTNPQAWGFGTIVVGVLFVNWPKRVKSE